MWSTFAPAIVAAVAGLAYVAYFYADLYDSLRVYLMIGVIIMFGLASCWSMAVHRTFTNLLPLLENHDQARRVCDRLHFPVDRLALVCGGLLLFLWLLTLLPAPQ